MKTCKICQVVKPLTDFNPASTYKEKIYYRGECKECNLKKQSSNQTAQIKYRASEKGATKKREYKKTEKYIKQQNEYGKNRYKTDKKFALKKNLRDRLSKALKAKSWKKNTKFSEYIGCDLDQLKTHLESKFQPGMIWDNYGEWEIDHIQPLSLAKTEQEMYDRCHYTNLQPLWRLDNIKKGNKIN